MPYRFAHTDASVQHGLRRIAGEQLGTVAKKLTSGPEQGTAIHGARKAIKKTRALLRLLRPGMPDYARENRALRDIGRALAPLRDADVTTALLARLCDEAGLVQADRAALSVAPGMALPDDPQLVLQKASEDLSRVVRRSAKWRVKGKSLDALAEGLRRSTEAGASALEPALAGTDPELLHEFRKRVKDRWYHSRLLFAAWPEAMQVEIDAADVLAERLGDYQDLAVLAERLQGEGPAADTIRALIRSQRQKLLAQVAPLARRLYAEAPDALAARRMGWWRAAQPDLPGK